MKKSILLLSTFCAAVLVLTGCQQGPTKDSHVESTIQNPIPLKFGDPFLLHASDGRFYMYGTSLEDGFEAFVSDDLVNWESCGQIYHGGDSTQWWINHSLDIS